MVKSGSKLPSISGIRLPDYPRVPPLVLLKDLNFWPVDPNIFLKAPLYINFEGEARAEKNANFWSKLSKKDLETVFFQKFACGRKKLAIAGYFWSFR